MKTFKEFIAINEAKVDIIKMLDREYGKGKLKHKDFVNNITFLGTEDGVDWYAMGIDDAENAETDVYMAKVYGNGNKIKLNDHPYTTIQGSDPDSQIKASIKRLKSGF